jgi:sporulation protein YlmC with PRC-barrel domain
MIRTLTLATALAAVLALPAIAEDIKAPSTAASSAQTAGLSLTSQEAEAWIGKPVYSSDGKKLGEVAAFQRAADNKVTEIHADIGGFLGLGEHRIRLLPAQINLASDRIVINMTAAQAKELPKIAK